MTGQRDGGVRVDRVEEKIIPAEGGYFVVHRTEWGNVKWRHCECDFEVNPTGWIWILGSMKVTYVTQWDSISGAYVKAMPGSLISQDCVGRRHREVLQVRVY